MRSLYRVDFRVPTIGVAAFYKDSLHGRDIKDTKTLPCFPLPSFLFRGAIIPSTKIDFPFLSHQPSLTLCLFLFLLCLALPNCCEIERTGLWRAPQLRAVS